MPKRKKSLEQNYGAPTETSSHLIRCSCNFASVKISSSTLYITLLRPKLAHPLNLYSMYHFHLRNLRFIWNCLCDIEVSVQSSIGYVHCNMTTCLHFGRFSLPKKCLRIKIGPKISLKRPRVGYLLNSPKTLSWTHFFFISTGVRTLRGCVDEMDDSVANSCRNSASCEICQSLGGQPGCNSNVSHLKSINYYVKYMLMENHRFYLLRCILLIVHCAINAKAIWIPIAALKTQIQKRVAITSRSIVVLSEKQVTIFDSIEL